MAIYEATANNAGTLLSGGITASQQFWYERLSATARGNDITTGLPVNATRAQEITTPFGTRFHIFFDNSSTGETQFEWRADSLTGTLIFTKIRE